MTKEDLIAKWEGEIATRKSIKKKLITEEAKREIGESIIMISDILKDVKKLELGVRYEI